MAVDLSGTRVLVVGSSTGIGRCVAIEAVKAGAAVVFSARSRDKLEAAAGSFEGKFGITAKVYAADLSLPELPRQIFEFTQNEGLSVDVLVNNAGLGLGGEFSETDIERQLGVIQVNVLALTQLTHLFLPQMIRRKSGRVLNLASTAAFQPGPLMSVYYATKAYVLSFSQALAEELRDTGVTVTALCPGPTRSEFAATAQMGETRLFHLPGVADAADVAEYGYHATMKGKRIAIPGMKNKFTAQANRIAPRILATKIARILQERR